MNKEYNYILVIDPNSIYDIDCLKEKLNRCLDWTRLFACTYVLHTNSDMDKLYSRFKEALPDNKFFIGQLNLSQGKYTGWLGESRWDRLREFRDQ